MNRSIYAMSRIGLLALALFIIGAAGVSFAEGRLSGEGEAHAKNLKRRTVTIAGSVYHVGERTVLKDIEGNRVNLRRLRVPEAGESEGLRELAWAAYEATEVRGKLVLQRLELQEPPE
ncbi:MAG: hypothetical protein ACQGVK_22380 [Myxococcota bacterium]